MTPVSPAEVVVSEAVVGVFSGAELGSAAVRVPSRSGLLGGTGLVVPPPGGDPVVDERLRSAVAQELGSLLGGWFHGGLAAAIELRDSLASRALRDRYASGGATIEWDRPRTAYSWLAFREDGWQVQAVGEAGDFHCVALARPLTAEEALGPGGHPRPQPAGPVGELLHRAAPRAQVAGAADRAAEHEPNVFDVYLEGRGLTVRGGVRQTITAGGGRGYHYVARLNLDLGAR